MECSPPGGIEARHLLREVTEGDIAVLSDETLDLGLCSQAHVLLALIGGAVVVGLAIAAARQRALLVKSDHDGHVRGVGAVPARLRVQRFHHGPHGRLARRPELLHHLGFELMQHRRSCAASRPSLGAKRHLRRRIAARGRLERGVACAVAPGARALAGATTSYDGQARGETQGITTLGEDEIAPIFKQSVA